MRNLFPKIPSLSDRRRSIILPIGLGLRAVLLREGDPFESLSNVWKTPPFVIYYNITLNIRQLFPILV